MVIGYAYYFGILKVIVPSQERFGEIERKVCCFRQRFGYVSAEGVVSGEHRPWTVFQHRWGRDDEEQVLQRAPAGDSAFKGPARTLAGGSKSQRRCK
jgi:hypothetical protein